MSEYSIIRQVGTGAFGIVYLAREIKTQELVAIKQLDKQDLIKKGKQDAVMREKQILKELTGKSFIIQIKQAFMDEESLYFVFEHCLYGTLSNLITVQGKKLSLLNLLGRLSEQLARVFAAEIVSGLKNMHEAGVMHRDLKPENIMIDEDLHLKIVNFSVW